MNRVYFATNAITVFVVVVVVVIVVEVCCRRCLSFDDVIVFLGC